MNPTTTLNLDASALTAFAGNLAALPADEIRKAKSLFIRNAIADYPMTLKSSKGFLTVMGVMCIIPHISLRFHTGILELQSRKGE